MIFMFINENINLLHKVFGTQILVPVFVVFSYSRLVHLRIVVHAVFQNSGNEEGDKNYENTKDVFFIENMS